MSRIAVTMAVFLAALFSQAGSAAADGPPSLDRYGLVHNCYALKSVQTGNWVQKSGGGYTADAASAAAAEPFRMQATDLGRYLFYGAAGDFLTRTAMPPDGVAPAATPSDDSDWTVNEDGSAFRIVNGFAGRDLAVAGGALTTVPEGTGGDAGLFTVDPVGGCADYPEIEVNVTGPLPPQHGPRARVQGFVETHLHHMAFEFLGSKAHCGRPWHRFGAPFALADCPDHGDTNDPSTEGCAAILETAISDTRCHNTDGWPSFAGWPTHKQLTHEQTYYKWVERAWRSGTRIFVNLLVENRVLCEIYPLTPPGHSCDEMDSVRLQAQRAFELQDYIDAQSGGPGEGFYRIVRTPEEARRVINDGKLAVVLGMEVSEPFGCRLMQPGNVSLCTQQQVEEGIDELYDLGLRQLELVNKFDNSLTGVAGDGGSIGTITNGGNFLSAGTFWDLEHCEDEVNHDHSPMAIPHNDDALIANGLDQFADLSGISPPVYGPPPHCNQRGLTELGGTAIQRMIDHGMLFDPDHMSVIARNQALDLVESAHYPGVMTSHSWSTDNANPRIEALGGLIGPYAGSSQGYVDKWNDIRAHGYDQMNPYLFGLGYGADMNGFGSQGAPRGAGVPNPVTYPFESKVFPGVMIDKQHSGPTPGGKTFDINVDGVAHYGLYPDWIQDVAILGGQEIIDDMANGAEAYLQMWERATGTSPGGGGGGGDDDNGNGSGGGSGSGQGGSGTPPSGLPGGGGNQQCAALRAKLDRATSKQARRKLRRKLRARDC